MNSDSEGMKLMVAVERGRMVADEVTGTALIPFNGWLAQGYELSPIGLRLVDGHEPTDLEFGEVIGGFLQATEGFKKAAGSSMWAAGDACLMVKATRGPEESDILITGIANERGIEPHSVAIAISTCSFYAHEERNPNASFSLHVEAASYSKKGVAIPKPEVLAMLDSASKGKVVTVVGKDGKETVRTESISCAEFRERLKERVGKKSKEEEQNGEHLPIPDALYPCKYCAEDYSWPATDLNWSTPAKGWVCSECWDSEGHGTRGISLDKEIQRQSEHRGIPPNGKWTITQAETESVN